MEASDIRHLDNKASDIRHHKRRTFDTGSFLEGRPAQITEDGRLRADVIATRAGVFPYLQPDGSILQELRHPDDVLDEASLATLGGVRVTDNHSKGLESHRAGDVKAIGTVGDDVEGAKSKKDQSAFVRVAVNIFDKDAIQSIRDGKQEVSLGYTADVIDEAGTFNGQPYKARQRNIEYFELAVVDRGRMNHGLDEPVVKVLLDSLDGAFQIAPGKDDGMTHKDNALVDDLNRAIDQKARERAASVDEMTEERARSEVISSIEDRTGLSWGTMRDVLNGRLQTTDFSPLQDMLGVTIPSMSALLANNEGNLMTVENKTDTAPSAKLVTHTVSFSDEAGLSIRQDIEVSPELAEMLGKMQARIVALEEKNGLMATEVSEGAGALVKAEGERDANASARDGLKEEIALKTKELEELKAKLEAAPDQMDADTLTALVKDRADLLVFAAKVLPKTLKIDEKDVRIDSLDELAIKQAIVEAERPGTKEMLDAAAKNADTFPIYLAAHYDSVKASLGDNPDADKRKTEKVDSDTRTDDGSSDFRPCGQTGPTATA